MIKTVSFAAPRSRSGQLDAPAGRASAKGTRSSTPSSRPVPSPIAPVAVPAATPVASPFSSPSSPRATETISASQARTLLSAAKPSTKAVGKNASVSRVPQAPTPPAVLTPPAAPVNPVSPTVSRKVEKVVAVKVAPTPKAEASNVEAPKKAIAKKEVAKVEAPQKEEPKSVATPKTAPRKVVAKMEAPVEVIPVENTPQVEEKKPRAAKKTGTPRAKKAVVPENLAEQYGMNASKRVESGAVAPVEEDSPKKRLTKSEREARRELMRPEDVLARLQRVASTPLRKAPTEKRGRGWRFECGRCGAVSYFQTAGAVCTCGALALKESLS